MFQFLLTTGILTGMLAGGYAWAHPAWQPAWPWWLGSFLCLAGLAWRPQPAFPGMPPLVTRPRLLGLGIAAALNGQLAFLLARMTSENAASAFLSLGQAAGWGVFLTAAGILLFALSRREPGSFQTAWDFRAFRWPGIAALMLGQALLFMAAGLALLPPRETAWFSFQELLIAGVGFMVLTLIFLFLYYFHDRSRFSLGSRLAAALFITLLAAAFVVWGTDFIWRTSLRLDRRYFCLFDDAMISMRYAWNLAHGHGLVWNPGEYVEGYTNFLMTLYMAIGAHLFDKAIAPLFSQISGIAFLLIAAWFTSRIAGKVLAEVPEERRLVYTGLAFAAPLLYYPLPFWSLFGMETGMLAMFASLAVWLALASGDSPRPNLLLSLALGLMFLTRPDAAVQAGVILAFRFWVLVLQKKNWPAFAAEAAVFAAFPLGMAIFRKTYYGEWLPNTYYLKIAGIDLSQRLANGGRFIVKFLASAWPALLAGFIGLWRWRIAKALIACLMLSAIAYQVYAGGDPWVYWRFLAPYFPLQLMLAFAGLEVLFAGIASLPKSRGGFFRPSGAVLAASLACWLLILGWSNAAFLPEFFRKTIPYATDYNGLNAGIGLKLSKICKPDATIGVIWAGVIPYYAGVKAVDFLGKCDKKIARLPPHESSGPYAPGHNKYDLKYSICQLQPDYVQNFYWAGNDEQVFVFAHYVTRDSGLFLKKDSPMIHWELVGP